jgi:rubrerythrin
MHWTIEAIDWTRLEPQRARADAMVYYLVAAGSFIETAADLYSANLAGHFSDPALRRWIAERWESEELQHGRALRRYVEAVWPELDWQRGYAAFFAEYAPLCRPDVLEQQPTLELAARCMVETGTATFYTALQRRAEEPVLKTLAERIGQDEVRHYTRFREFFDAHRRAEGIGRAGVLGALYRRAAAARNADAYLGFKYAWRMRHPSRRFHKALFECFRTELREMMASCYPYRMALQMLLRPLELNRTLVRVSLPLLERAARRLILV